MNLPARCVDLSPEQVVAALGSMAAMRALLEHMARIARPGEGAPKILVPIARMASSACDWIDGGLHVELSGTADTTQIMVATDLGGGVRELLLPRLFLEADLDEFFRAVKVAPKLVAPMKVRTEKGKLVLSCTIELIGSMAPPSFEIAEESMRRSLPAKLRRSLPPMQTASASIRVDMPVVDVAILARIVPKAPRVPVVDELSTLDVGWDLGAYSSTVNARETKPPPEPRPLSTAPTRPPPNVATPRARPSKAPHARASKAPPPNAPLARASKAPPPKAPLARASKAPPPKAPPPKAPPPKEPPHPAAKEPRPAAKEPPRPAAKEPAAPPVPPLMPPKRPAIRRSSKRPPGAPPKKP